VPELETVTLADPSSSLTATFVPAAGMIGTSLADGELEYLGQRRGLQAYLDAGKTMGIPLLYPWANRLSDTHYEADGAVVTLTPGSNGVRLDSPGIPIHGVLAAHPGWLVTERTPDSLTAVFDYAGRPALLASFPFPHTLIQKVTLRHRTLAVETTVMPATAAAVPLCFGYHPYFVLPGVPREQWTLTTPAMRHLPVDERGLPTGAHAPWDASTAALGDTTYDDGFDQVADDARFVLEGGDHRIEVTFESGYPAAQLFAPPTDAIIAIEPMTAPTDALRSGNHRWALPGRPDVSRFTVRVG
jgi:aldose 1-epimerase